MGMDRVKCYAQYTPPTQTRLNCRVELRRRRVGGVYWALAALMIALALAIYSELFVNVDK